MSAPIPNRTPEYGTKALQVGLMGCLLAVCLCIVWALISTRERDSRAVDRSIVEQWGESVDIQGPMLNDSLDCSLSIVPYEFTCHAKVDAQTLHRNIYETQVFTADVDMTFSFLLHDLRVAGPDATISLELGDTEPLNLAPLETEGRKVEWKKVPDTWTATYYVPVSELNLNLDSNERLATFTTRLQCRGSNSIRIQETGGSSKITISGNATGPSFGGAIPVSRKVTDNTFTATWDNSTSSRYTAELSDYGYAKCTFLSGVDKYRKVDRAAKYGFLIIFLTLLSVLCVEVIKKQPIPLLNYFLIGAALVLFYSLLLSMSEFVTFGVAYLIASIMTVGLIAGYIAKMMQSRAMGMTIGGVLSVLYALCFGLLIVSTYALLMGSLVLFAALGGAMYASLRIPRA